jgi:hypothetical protein
MAFFCNGSGRTSRDAFAAFFVLEEKTVFFILTVLPFGQGLDPS